MGWGVLTFPEAVGISLTLVQSYCRDLNSRTSPKPICPTTHNAQRCNPQRKTQRHFSSKQAGERDAVAAVLRHPLPTTKQAGGRVGGAGGVAAPARRGSCIRTCLVRHGAPCQATMSGNHVPGTKRQ